ncbi:MAG: CehA/McbA family metallohydrolase [Acidobacteria bacterium]|nr:CehA/McbA family metallohydrolase [Acidobacteriota bacterium]
MAPHSVLPADVADRWLVVDTFRDQPMEPQLSGLDLEYRIVLLYSRDTGRREAQLGAQLGVGTDDIGFRNRTAVLFEIAPSRDVTLHVRDELGRPTTASFVIRDTLGRVYPARSKRLAPDFFFQNQIYRADGESVRLPTGEFTVLCGRGPEYLPEARVVTLNGASNPRALDFNLRRWIDPPAHKWYSGDHHIHAAGCAHYESPTEGVRPEDMMRHVLGEALSVGAVLNWGPSYYHQRQFFEAKDNKLSTKSTRLRYDVEVSGFPSSHCGHLVLLRLREQDFPETRQIEDWPSWDLPILKWAKAQDAIAGFAHSGWGLEVKTRDLPNYEMPNFDGIGANEYVVDVTHDLVDFISAADTPFVYELNIWYQTLNCGFRTRISGETDFPCISDERVGAGRSYVHLPDGLTYDAWCEGVRLGRSYVSDGFSHLMGFAVNGQEAGTGGSELRLEQPGTLRATARVACLLREELEKAEAPEPTRQPYWTPQHARIAGSREVTVEAVVNGRPVASMRVIADGVLHDVAFDIPVDRSSWIALRILGSAHTNPMFLLVGDRPIRASKRSAEWCLKAVDQCWSQKSGRMRAAEREAARQAYEHARGRYRQILSESET